MSNTFVLNIHSGTWDSLSLGSARDASWAKLQAIAATPIITVTLNDIEGYDWEHQVFTLTQTASKAVLSHMPGAAPRAPATVLDHHAFVVTDGSKPVYGGVFLMQGSPMVVNYPCIYANYVNDHLIFVVRPLHSIFEDYSGAPEDWYGIRAPQLRDTMERGKKVVK